MNDFLKKNIKVIIAFVLGLIVSGTGVYAATIIFDSNQVGYDNSNTNLQINNANVDNVQDAIDAIYIKTTGLQTQLNTCTGDLSTAQGNYSTCSNYLSTCSTNLTTKTNQYNTCSSSLSTCQTNLSTAQSNEFLTKYNTMSGTPLYYAWGEYPSSSTSRGTRNLYIARWSDDQIGVCINRSGTEYCFRYNNWFGEKEHVQEVFGASNCTVDYNQVGCVASDFDCLISSTGAVNCSDRSTNNICYTHGLGSISCY